MKDSQLMAVIMKDVVTKIKMMVKGYGRKYLMLNELLAKINRM
jgi:hypothetical protein